MSRHRLSGRHVTNDVKDLQTLISKVFDVAIEMAEDLAEGGEKYAPHIAAIEKQVQGMARADHHVDLISKAVTSTETEESKYRDTDGSEPPPHLGEVFDTELAALKSKDFDVSKHPKVVKFMHRMKDVGEEEEEEGEGEERMDTPEDEDLIVEQVQISLTCPLTRKFLEDPVTSDKCKHSYSRTAILNHIRNRTKKQHHPCCPVCNEPLSEGDLQSDERLQRMVLRAQRKKGKGKGKGKGRATLVQ